MRVFSRLFLFCTMVVFSGQAWATKVVLVSSEIPAKVTSEEKIKQPEPAEPRPLSDQQEQEKRERLLKELQELYKQGRPLN